MASGWPQGRGWQKSGEHPRSCGVGQTSLLANRSVAAGTLAQISPVKRSNSNKLWFSNKPSPLPHFLQGGGARRPLSSASKAAPSCSGPDSRPLLSAGRDLRRGRSSARGAVHRSSTYPLIHLSLRGRERHLTPAHAAGCSCRRQPGIASRPCRAGSAAAEIFRLGCEIRTDFAALSGCGSSPCSNPSWRGVFRLASAVCFHIIRLPLNVQFLLFFSSTVTTLNSPMTCHCQASAFSLILRQL